MNKLNQLRNIMEQAQVFASAWSLVGTQFDNGQALADAENAKVLLFTMVRDALTPDPRLAMYQATLGVAKTAMEAFADQKGRMPVNTGEFNDLKNALFAVRMALPLCEEFEPTRPQLLLAAPDLLKACKRAEEWLEGWASAESCLSDIRAAIAKAGATS